MSYRTPTICVGNLNVGGTGKTPMIEVLIALFPAHKIAVLSRGYRRKTRGFVLANSDSTARQIGDEPLQIYLKFPNVHVAVDEDRQRGILNLEEKIKPDLILLDDAFQHRKVRANFYILLSAYDNLYKDDWYLPTGNLRDSKSEAKRADIIIITKCPQNLSEAEQSRIIKRIDPKPSQDVLFSSLVYDDNISGFKAGTLLTSLRKESITLVTGIANPKPLVMHLQSMGLKFTHLAFKDHHFFTKKEIELLNSKSLVLTTEKDYMRAKDQIEELSYLPVRHTFFGDGNKVLFSRLTGVL